MKQYDTIIVGGGPSGMTAALQCAVEGQSVLLLDRCDKIGKKLLVTGNGKCNLTNLHQSPDCYRGESPEAIAHVLSSFGLRDAMGLFESLGICTREKNGYVYPYNEQAAAVRAAFEAALAARDGLTVRTETSVTGIEASEDGFMVTAETLSAKAGSTKKTSLAGDVGKNPSAKKISAPKNRISRFLCRSLIIACGGLAGVKLGCDGSGYTLAQSMGHSVITPLPALTALKSSAPFLKRLSGVRNQARITLLVDGKEVCREQGELQWTDYGISGVVIFQLSRFAILALEEGKKVGLSLHFMPEYTIEQVEQLLQSCRAACPYKTFEEMLAGILPVKLAPIFLREAGIDTGAPVREQGNDAIRKLAIVIGNFPLRINGYVGYEKAQVTRGGVAMGELTEELESRLCPGLFFAGEVLDVDGTCGGYNLQWAFSSGSVAGQAALRRNRFLFW